MSSELDDTFGYQIPGSKEWNQEVVGTWNQPGQDDYRDWRAMEADDIINSGLLSEVNRRFFHPVGLDLVLGDDGAAYVYETDDPVGYTFAEECLSYKAAQEYDRRFYERLPKRYAEYGYSIQPITEDMKDENSK